MPTPIEVVDDDLVQLHRLLDAAAQADQDLDTAVGVRQVAEGKLASAQQIETDKRAVSDAAHADVAALVAKMQSDLSAVT